MQYPHYVTNIPTVIKFWWPFSRPNQILWLFHDFSSDSNADNLDALSTDHGMATMQCLGLKKGNRTTIIK